ncbi:colicin D domain-containing protein [Papillibacter cinnamivorans]|uniref:Colicin D n=1 Tax=Papillibacter cinnamivorans DSM 12816 TaxID=1122930 RepID=A0A1W2C512_9FIRM|nr:colicin D domain-containing protein [Papillibacter cinnamivorans]SMC80299.1 Colicin D [Papillibacter cinnamivorans DSM 12816]
MKNALDSGAAGSGSGEDGKTPDSAPGSVLLTLADGLKSAGDGKRSTGLLRDFREYVRKPDTSAEDGRMRRENRYAEENTASPTDRLKSLEKAIQLQRAKIQGLYDAYLYGDAEQEEKKLSLLERQYATENKRDLDRFIAEWTEEIDRQRQEQREQEILDLYNLYVPLPQETVASQEEEGYTGNGETTGSKWVNAAYFAGGYIETGWDEYKQYNNLIPHDYESIIDNAKQALNLCTAVSGLADSLISHDINAKDLLYILGDNAKESLIGDILYIKDHADLFKQFDQLTPEEAWDLGERTRGAVIELEKIGFTVYMLGSSVKSFVEEKGVLEGTGQTIKNIDDVNYGQSSLDKAFSKHSADFGTYPDGSNASRELFKSDINDLLRSGIQKSGTYRSLAGIHVYNSSTRLWAFYDTNGNFITAFKLSLEQLKYLIETGVVK